MIKIYPSKSMLILSYEYTDGGPIWVKEKLKQDGEFTLRKTFTFEAKDVLDEKDREIIESVLDDEDYLGETADDDPFDQDDESISFVLGNLVGEYYQIEKGKITYDHDVYLHKDIDFDVKLFVSHRNISVFSKLEHFTKNDIYIGGEAENTIPEIIMWDLIKKFPNTHQKNLYEGSVITSIIREYVDNIPDYRAKYEKYLNKRQTVKASDLGPILRDQEIHKFILILDKLESMLKQQIGYSELQWQEEILTIITLIYPKYVYAFKNVQLKRKDQTDLYVDILLVDSGGYADILEIKKPFESVIITQATYRDNHIPYRELTGTVMQIEKYIYHLNRWGADGEKILTQKLSGLPQGFEVKLTNPGGLVIMGRDNNLSADQKSDFEVVKRKYKNIMDILTYDELLRRLRFMIEMWTNKPFSES
ncbi:Shedu immune nuclease family protein [Mucilaginibacter sp. UC70_90]